jgi:RecJ-like exonuclease
MYDGSRCPICHGRGDTHVDCETCGGEGEIDASCEDCGEPATMRDPHEDYLCAECYASRERDDAARMEAP